MKTVPILFARLIVSIAVMSAALAAGVNAADQTYDLVVYGGTSGGGASQEAGQVGRDRLPGQAFGRTVERRSGLDRHGQQSGDRRPGPRVLSPRVEALRPAGGLEVANARAIRQQGARDAGHRRRPADDVDL